MTATDRCVGDARMPTGPSMLALLLMAGSALDFGTVGCLSVPGVDQVGTEEGDKPLASAEAVFLDFEFDGEVIVPTGSDPLRAIDLQLLFTVGQLNGDRSVGRLDQVQITGIRAESEGDRSHVRYRALMPVAWGNRDGTPATYTLLLPLDVVSPNALERFTDRYRQWCVDWEAQDVTPGNIWFFYRPNRWGCQIEHADVATMTASVTPSALSTTGRYPEYDEVWEDGVLRIVSIFAKSTHRATSNGDLGISAYNRFPGAMRAILSGATVTTDPEDLPDAPGVQVPYFEIRADLPNGRRVEIEALLVDDVTQAGPRFDARYDALSSQADVITYSGHANRGESIQAIARKGRWVRGQYLIFLMNACDTYAYLDGSLWEAHGAVNPDDPNGTRHLDILANAMPSFYSSDAASMSSLVGSLMNTDAPKTYEQIFAGFDQRQVVLVAGEEDNDYTPSGSQ